MLGYLLAVWIYEREKKPRDLLVLWIQYFMLGGLVGARLADVLFYNLSYYLSDPILIPQVWKGGLSSHGGAIGIFVATLIFCKRHHGKLLWHLDRLALVMPIAGALIRLGNLMNSEIIGKPSEVPWAFIFKSRSDLPRHPSQLYETLMLLLVFCLLITLYRKGLHQKPGALTSLFFTLTFGLRFLLEFFKEETAVSQPLNLLFCLLGTLSFLLIRRHSSPSDTIDPTSTK